MKVPNRFVFASVLVLSSVVSGCGEPVLRAMTPQVKKSAVWVFLVNNPSNWSATDAHAAVAGTSVVAKVSAFSSQDMVAQLRTALKSKGVGLFVGVESGPIPASVLTLIGQYPTRKFEWICTQNAQVPSLRNLRVIVPDGRASTYLMGSLAGELASTVQSPVVGWITNGNVQTTKLQLQEALTGVYDANPAVTNVPVVPSAGTTQGQSLRQPLPKVVVVTRALDPVEIKFLRKQGTILIPLVDQRNSSFAATQVLPGPEVLHQDILKYAKQQWSTGMQRVSRPPFIAMNGSYVSKTSQTVINNLSLALQRNPQQIVTDWTAIPNAIKTQFASIIAVGKA